MLIVLLITHLSLIGCYTYRVVFFHFALFMDRFLKRAAPSSSPAVAPSAKRPAPAAKQGHVTAFILLLTKGLLVSAADKYSEILRNTQKYNYSFMLYMITVKTIFIIICLLNNIK